MPDIFTAMIDARVPVNTLPQGDASQLSDSAAAVVLMEAKDAEKRGPQPLGRFVAWTAARCAHSQRALEHPSLNLMLSVVTEIVLAFLGREVVDVSAHSSSVRSAAPRSPF